jgi:secondary thiamine-phosphate synthase enzyme
MGEFVISTSERTELVNITHRVEGLVAASKVKEGICLVYAPHATAAIMVLEMDGTVEKDVLRSLLNIVPNNSEYKHCHGPTGHGAAHVKSALFGPSKVIPVHEGRLQLGTWHSIAFCEFDGPRSNRKVVVKVVSE